MPYLKIRKFDQIPVRIIEPDGTVHETDNLLEFNDLKLQIKNLKLDGCIVEFKNQIIPINCFGRLQTYPTGLFTDFDDILDALI